LTAQLRRHTEIAFVKLSTILPEKLPIVCPAQVSVSQGWAGYKGGGRESSFFRLIFAAGQRRQLLSGRQQQLAVIWLETETETSESDMDAVYHDLTRLVTPKHSELRFQIRCRLWPVASYVLTDFAVKFVPSA